MFSMRSRIRPPARLAMSCAVIAAKAWPRCKWPVGLGANRVTIMRDTLREIRANGAGYSNIDRSAAGARPRQRHTSRGAVPRLWRGRQGSDRSGAALAAADADRRLCRAQRARALRWRTHGLSVVSHLAP